MSESESEREARLRSESGRSVTSESESESESESQGGARALPPYGYMPEKFRREVALFPVPQGFRWQGRPATAADYTEFIESEAARMASFLWPVYDRETGKWIGSAEAGARALTAADIKVMGTLRGMLSQQVTCGENTLQVTHRELFRQEDESAIGTVDLYMSGLAPDVLRALRKAIDGGFIRLGPTHLRLKEKFQRPRPYQMSYVARASFAYEVAVSAVTPALVSGHGLQGLVVRTLGYVAQRNAITGANDIACLQQYCVDIGDRRVFAGVHYPSDNISSWYTGLRLCDHLFEDPQEGAVAKRFMVEAIRRSAVHAAIVQAVAQDPNSPYKSPMFELKQESERAVGAPTQPVGQPPNT